MIVLGVLLALTRQSPAIELSLEENRAQRGNIGFVDMRRVYRLFPETLRAKEHFEEVIRQAEEQVGLRKAEILKLKNEISRLRAEQEALKNLAPPPPVAPPSPAPAAPPTETPAPAAAIGAASKETLSAAAALLAQEGLTVSTKGGSDQAALDALLSTRTAVAALPGLAAPAASGVVITTEVQTSTPAVAPAPVPAPVPPPPPAPAAHAGALAELAEKLAVKTRELETRERDFKEHQAAAEKNLMDLESRRTEILLGKIHKAVQETARREGISVVVDKGAILFGHEAVDLTEKVLKSLKGS